ncbi:bifunctional indole-3-glycerol-phosphate synthase TrpC/phosphoribosylanthranilate isomerase TrpF [Thalassotalea sp. M1531]|uniref:Multifunctional fusion protein n=1 Tax=Thalassotalea algicola TaxID=2716224 RepID=A0A7Y0LFP6_9GAMM|nr:bifunctional indole-3-glycerol-phosphate synthase TrpC/phosphoribosylanthranilate isomerase TrpF [Thalassotalea algicola]NMP33488.1 bifunctional indole-3-glycerol-phosphate synthase TrpC/phosphoribosylanthranilate isomerase TrpF [Thalassotalea algicola]
MANVLEKIVADKYIEIDALKKSKPLESFINQLKPTQKDLYGELSKDDAGFILECKKASPSKGLIRPDFDVVEIAKTYDKYAAGISVLTDEKYFQGTFDYLKQVTDVVKSPVLNKDFFIDTYQVHLARYYGADAILLMLSVLNDEQYQSLANVAKSYNLAILTEVSNQEEVERAIALDAKLIGINNRNLRDLSTDITRTFEFAPYIPDDRLVISESGIYTNAQVRELAPAVNGFLVGSSIMAKDDIDLACRELIYGHNKVCGLTRNEDALAIKAQGAIYGGLIFAEKSPRCIDIEQAKTITNKVNGLNYIGVFVNHPVSTVAEIANTINLFAVQLHGNENQDYIAALKPLLPAGCVIWKAISVEDQVPDLNLKVDKWLLDGKSPGSGKAFNWQALASSEQDLSACLLAGGIGIDNIDTAIDTATQHELFGLDINSGIENEPGIKSAAKIEQVFAHIRNY